jgi:hypothetical protein
MPGFGLEITGIGGGGAEVVKDALVRKGFGIEEGVVAEENKLGVDGVERTERVIERWEGATLFDHIGKVEEAVDATLE